MTLDEPIHSIYENADFSQNVIKDSIREGYTFRSLNSREAMRNTLMSGVLIIGKLFENFFYLLTNELHLYLTY